MLMAAILQECPIYSRVTVVGKLYDVKETATSSQMTRYNDLKIIDDSNISRSIIFFDHFNIIEEGKTFKITNVMVTKYHNKKILHDLEKCSITRLEYSALAAKVPSGNDTNLTVGGIIAMVESKTLQPRYCCTKCDKKIRNSDDLFFCCGSP